MSLRLIKKIDFPYDIFVFALFGIYSLSVAPYLTEFLTFGDTNYFVAFFGFLIYILEIFAFQFKLYMIRFRVEDMRIWIRQSTGEEKIIPRLGIVVWFGIFFRIVFRIGILYLSVSALGLSTISGSMLATFIMLVVPFLEFILSVYLMVSSGLFNPEITYKWESAKEIAASDKWVNEEFGVQPKNLHIKELVADIILSIYAFMLYTGIWEHINATAIKMVDGSYDAHEDVFSAALNVFAMLFILVIFALPTLRLVYWIEGYASFSDKERWRTRGTFWLIAVITIAPTITHFYRLYFLK